MSPGTAVKVHFLEDVTESLVRACSIFAAAAAANDVNP